jgi:hypothetical protein
MLPGMHAQGLRSARDRDAFHTWAIVTPARGKKAQLQRKHMLGYANTHMRTFTEMFYCLDILRTNQPTGHARTIHIRIRVRILDS